MDSTIGKYGQSVDKVLLSQSCYETPPKSDEEPMDEARNPGFDGGDLSISPPQRHIGDGLPTRPRRLEEEISAEERARREEQESLELARALMAEEAMASYAQSLDYLRNNQDQFSEEDLAALQAAMDEEQHQHEMELNAEAEEAIDGDDNGDSYEFMLRLGERIGDVKTERWEQVARQKIEKIPIVQYDPENLGRSEDINDCDIKCLVCQEEYCKGENLRKLPCGHCFHKECVDQWLLSKDFCPYCRTTLDKD